MRGKPPAHLSARALAQRGRMYQIINFNSVLEIGFAVNAILVIFELESYLEKRFKKIQGLGRNEINLFVKERDQYHINNYGWRSLAFGYVIWIGRLKLISIFNSLLCLLLLLYAGYNPEVEVGLLTSMAILLLIFLPVLIITFIILYALPYYKFKCIKAAIASILAREKKDLDDGEYEIIEKKYHSLISFIKYTNFPFLLLIRFRKGKKLSDDIINLFDVKSDQ